MGLSEYKRKRHFDITPEPSAKSKSSRVKPAVLHFVVQKHRASHLHYDFRLEWKGVLLSWAVPKGPSLDPGTKRLAMAVEDHPLDYAGFEGIIPAGQYGGGTVMVWDQGTYVPESADVGKSLQAGEIKFVLRGKKLQGGWVLVRTGGRDSRSWLLIKHRDGTESKEDIAVTQPRSVVSKRLLAQIAHDSGGDVEKAASGDPPDAIRALVKSLKTGSTRRASKRPAATQPAIWQSNRRRSAS